MIYPVRIIRRADNDIDNLIDFIDKRLNAPITAEKFSKGIYKSILSLHKQAHIYSVFDKKYFKKTNSKIRQINDKGFAIIYTIEKYTVNVLRIIHGSLII